MKAYYVLTALFLSLIFLTACSTPKTSNPDQLHAQDKYTIKKYSNKVLEVNVLLPVTCDLIEQPRMMPSIFSMTSDNGKGSKCKDNVNIFISDKPIEESVLDEQEEISMPTPNVSLGVFTGTWYEGKTAEGGKGYSFDYIGSGPYYLWFNYLISPRLGHENELQTDIDETRALLKNSIASLKVAPLTSVVY